MSRFTRMKPRWGPRRSIVGLTLAVNLGVEGRLAWQSFSKLNSPYVGANKRQ